MPPALSDEENGVSSSEEEIPFRGKVVVAASVEPEPEATPDVEDDEEEEAKDEEDDDVEEDEYVVEKILQHKFVADTLLYQVKWQGFEKKQDLTWEPEDNLSGAMEILKEYFKSIGGRPESVKGKKRKGRKSATIDKSESATPASSSKRAKKEREWSPPPGSWENDVDYVDTVEQGEDIDKNTGELAKYAYMVWKNGRKSQHPLPHVYLKCPQKMLVYYESHLVFTTPTAAKTLNGDDNDLMDEGAS